MPIRKNSLANQLIGIAFLLVGLGIVCFGLYALYEVALELLKVRVYPFVLFGAFILLCCIYWAVLRAYRPVG